MRKLFSTIVLPLACLALFGCMSGILRVDTVSLRSSLQPRPDPIPNAYKINIGVKVEDRRTNSGGWLGGKLGRLRVGYAENAFGESIAPQIAVDTPLETSFENAFEAKLAAYGFKIKKNSPTQLVIQIDHFFTKFKTQFGLGLYVAIAELRMKISLIDQDENLIYEKVIYSKGQSSMALSQDGETAEVALNKAFDAGISSLFDDKNFIFSISHIEAKPSP